jgi:hypothetical protein
MGEMMQWKLIHGSILAIMAVGLVVLGGFVWSAPASAASRQVYLAVNGADPRSATVAPRDAAISVDSSLFLDNMVWTRWDAQASGTGAATVNLCEPDCAAGKTVKIPVSVTLNDPRSLCGREFFTAMLLTLTGRVPVGLERSSTVPVTPLC